MAEASEPGAARARSDAWGVVQVFAGVTLGFGALYLASAMLFAGPGVFLALDGSGVERLARFNVALAVVLAYLCAALRLGQHWGRHDFPDLRGVVDASEEEWSAWIARLRSPDRGRLLRALALGAACGLVVDAIGGRVAEVGAIWRGHLVWVWILNPVLFAVMGMLLSLSGVRARVYRELGRRTRVTLGDIAPLAPFARAGLRTALLWLVGTSLASVLLVDTDSPMLVIVILLVTSSIGVTSLLAPSRGLHDRLREAKREELAWLRAEIARASAALRRGDAPGAEQLPALLAWEARVAGAPEWPFDASTVARFALFLLVPLGSWLGSAVAERFVERWLGA
jgi:hypothetical protein